jgi:hypothetical protein
MKSRNTQKSAEPFFRPGAETAMLVMTPNFGAPCRQAKKSPKREMDRKFPPPLRHDGDEKAPSAPQREVVATVIPSVRLFHSIKRARL